VITALLAGPISPTGAAAGDQKGIGDNGPVKLTDQTAAQLSDTIADFTQLGVKWVRFDFDWSVIEPTRGEYRLNGYDAAVRELSRAGINVLGVIDYTPPWANGEKGTRFYPPTKADDYGNLAGYLASRYAPMGVHAWEIWNEPNVGQFWQPAPEPRAYTALLKSAYHAIHGADPRAIVITGGLAQPRNGPTSIAAIDFVKAIYAGGARPYLDAVGDHPYNSPRLPSDPSPSNNWHRMRDIREIMSAHGDVDKQLWITEYGAPTQGVSPYSQKIVISEAQQATMVREAYAVVRTYAWAGPLFWYEYQDLCPPAETQSSECYYGLVRSDGSRKPAYGEYRSAPN
jgi:hypothetical protein